MKNILLCSFLLVLAFTGTSSYAQSNFNGCQNHFEHRLVENEYGATILEIRASVANPCGKAVSDMSKKFKIWGVLICYSVNGEKKVKRQDLTYDLKNKGVFTSYLSYSENDEVGFAQVHYFDASKDPSTYPQKSCDFFQ